MTDIVGYELRENVARIVVNNPPVNALTQAVRAGLTEAFARAEADPEVQAVVLMARGRTFPAGADVRDFRAVVEAPSLGALCRQIERLPKPVLAAVHGTALGGGLELALACHYRIALREAQLGLPDVALGVVPTAGGTQRLPRIVGPRAALDMLISGKPVTAQLGQTLGLVDRVIEKNLGRAAMGSARNMAEAHTPPRPSRDRAEGFRDPARFLEVVQARRVLVKDDPRVAIHRVIDLVEASLLLPFEAGLEMERVSFEDLVDSEQALGLRHAFLAERRTGRVPAAYGATARKLERIGVIGGGTLGAGIVLACIAAGKRVTLAEVDADGLERAQTRIAASLDRAIDKGALTRPARDAQLALVHATTKFDELAEADLVIEAVPEEIEAKRAVFARLGAVTRPGTVLASTTSRLDLSVMAQAAARPEDVMGLHVFAPAHRLRLVEVSAPEGAPGDLVATGMAFARSVGKVPVWSKAVPGYIAGNVFQAYAAAADALVLEGARIAHVDAVMRAYGFPFGPFEARDVRGLAAADPEPQSLAGRLIAAGRIGRASGRGFYRYAEAGTPGKPDRAVSEVIEAMREAEGIEPRPVSVDEIRLRCVLAMTAEGARLLEAGVALRPGDIDAAMILGFGFPRWHGGPMAAADRMGLLSARKIMREWAETRAGDVWRPAFIFDGLIKNGQGFDDLNA